MGKMIIDASNLILGRMGSKIAKKALLGEQIDIVNCEMAVITGNRKQILLSYMQKKELGQPTKGPFMQRQPDRFVRRSIRGMLPYKQEKGRNAYSRIKCWVGVPEAFKDQKMESISEANISKLPNLRFITIKELCRQIGGKI